MKYGPQPTPSVAALRSAILKDIWSDRFEHDRLAVKIYMHLKFACLLASH